MIEKVFRLGKETAIYGLSSIVGRFLNFLLVPIYTNFLSPAQYGVFTNLYAYIAFIFVIYGYGMDSAYMRFVSTLEMGDKKQNFSTPFASLVVTSLVLSIAIYLAATPLGVLVGLTALQGNLVQYAAWILFFDTLSIVPFAYLRMENRAKTFAGLRVLNIVINGVLTVIFLALLHMGIEAMFIANLVASASTFVVLLWIALPQLTLRFSKPLYREFLRFGLPYIPASLASIAIQVIDRPIVKALTNDATLGIYQASYRLGVFMMLVVGMFDYAWRPFFLTHAKDPDARELFAKVFTYLVSLMMLLFVGVSLFIDDIVRLHLFGGYFINPRYWGGLSIVPVVLLAYVFTGAYVNFVVGVYLEKKTKYLPYATGAGALVNVVANYVLIPRIGIMGAAIATLLSYIVMAIGIYFPSQRLYHVPYEWGRIARLVGAALAAFLIYSVLDLEPASLYGIIIKAVICLAFIVLVLLLRVFDRADLEQTKAAISRMFGRS